MHLVINDNDDDIMNAQNPFSVGVDESDASD